MDKDYLQPDDAPVTQKSDHVEKLLDKRNPFAPPVFVSKGTVESTLGGRTTFKDSNGGTLLTYDPDTGTITIFGGLVTQQNVNVGTLSNSVFTGTITNTGIIQGGTFGAGTLNTPSILGGTISNAYISGGTTSNITGQLSNVIFTGTQTFPVNTGSPTLTTNGNFAIETRGTGGILAFRVGGTTFYVTATGTLI